MNCDLIAIGRPCRAVRGSLKRLMLINPDDLSAQPEWQCLPTIADLSFNPGKAAYLFEQDLMRAQLVSDTDTGADAGDAINYTLTAFFSNIRLDFESLRSRLLNRRVHVIATYQDDTQQYLPYMRLRAKSDSGEKGGRNGYTVTGTCRLDGPAPLLDAALEYISPDGTITVPPSETPGVTTVATTTTDDNYIYAVPAGKWLVGVYVKSDEAQTVALGLSAGEEDLGGTNSADADQPIIFQCNNLRPGASTNIYLSGLAGTNEIEIWLLG